MSKLERLIQQYCPDGVVFYHLNDVATIKRGERVTKTQLIPEGQYPVISGGVKPLGYLDRYNREANTITIAQYGTAGYVDWQQKQFWANDVCYSVFPSKIINNRFLYFVLLSNQRLLYSLKTNAIPACLPLDKLADIEIPVPPLPVQEEIVRILDTFTELQAELQAELQKRQQQYNFYRDNLLNFNRGGQEIKWMKMSDVFEIRNGYTPSKANNDFWEGGTIPWFRMEDIRQNGRILSDSISHITPKGVKGKGLFSANSFIIATTATIGEHALLIADSLANQQFTNLKIRKLLEKELSIKFFYYYLFIIDEWCKSNINLSNFASVDMVKFNNLRIPIPPLEEQNRIVAILDRFDTLTNDLTSGLPAEMEKRRQQYEYYRDRLLTFKRL